MYLEATVDENIFQRPGHLINRLARISARWTEERFQPLGLSVGQMPVLYALKDGASMTQKELARLARIEQPTMAQLLARMERDGLIRRSDNPEDRRSSLISLTPLALKKVPLARAILTKGNQEGLKGFTDREIATLSRLLLRVVKNFDPEIAAEIESMHAR
jgi:MarR family transcriptional regulator, transcriptional regulator for hemolysin